ncbi:LacI family DNA-binding transcriptional regulator [Manganibacter manganicus]|uniref:LacI family transcriptional regulator n=1 Tax=Manganibacter manganicus TaxID=1873176 RepID=A0A1V8RMP9_9HYPH|nr:LacI family DNA-binding transcriptional regulator [Pseudaminobacter manganicus]OQM74259.1 LacI family transcriptional regulator [Pseudaminobacter manganicus]
MASRHPDNPRSAPTIRDVADAAKVSRATVSRAFGQPNLLSRETVALVRATAERLGYVPNPTARALSTGRAGNIALVVPDITNPFFAAMMRGGQARARDQGYATFIGDSDEAPELEDMLLGKLAGQVEGFILASSRLPSGRILEHARRRPFVLINRDLHNIPRLLVDTGPSYAQAVEHLASLGHRTVAYVAGPTRSWSNRQRYNATVRTARRLGVEVVRIATSRPSFEAGQASTDELVRAGVTAALAFDDVMAQGIMAGLAGRGISVPGDFSIVGCDGILAPTFYPPLTSVEAHCAEAGEQAVDLLVEAMQGNASAGRRIVLATELVIRTTTAVPPPRRHNKRRHTHANINMEQS